MPAYSVEFLTEEGPRRGQFTIDPGRELGPQVRQVLEELRQQGVVLAGRPGDTLEVSWNGRTLDLGKTPDALALAPSRALEIRMRAPAVTPPPPPPPPKPRRRPRAFTRGAYAGVLTGAAGALAGWAVAATVRDLGPLVPTYGRLDLLAAALLGGSAGAAVAAGAALRTQARLLPASARGLVLGLVGGALGGALGLAAAGLLPATTAAFPLRRLVAWALLGAGAGAAVGLEWLRRDPRRVAEGAMGGALGGALAGLVFSFGGPGDLWQAVAFALVGAGVGGGACAFPLRRADGVLELEALDGRAPGLLAHREWELREGAPLRVGRWRRRGPRAALALQEGRAWAGPGVEGEAIAVSGRAVAGPVELADGDRIDLGGARFRFRRLAGAA